ncbi:MAG: hypothetical protein Kow0031_13180 [Anaerolineae bacterium]
MLDIARISTHLDAALDNDAGSGDHWILMSLLDEYGFRTNGTGEAMELAERIIVRWYSLQK